MDLVIAGSTSPSVSGHTRVLRWLYRRGDDSLLCELGLAIDDSVYELRFAPPYPPVGPATERFNDAVRAFQRLTAIERLLLDEGWSLESFESLRVQQS